MRLPEVAQPFRAGLGPHPQYGWDCPVEIPEKSRKDPGPALRAYPRIPLASTAGTPQSLLSKAKRHPEHLQNPLPPVRLGTLLSAEVAPERAFQASHGTASSTGGMSELSGVHARAKEREKEKERKKEREGEGQGRGGPARGERAEQKK